MRIGTVKTCGACGSTHANIEIYRVTENIRKSDVVYKEYFICPTKQTVQPLRFIDYANVEFTKDQPEP